MGDFDAWWDKEGHNLFHTDERWAIETVWQAATERAAGIAYERLMTMGYQMRADDVRDAIRKG